MSKAIKLLVVLATLLALAGSGVLAQGDVVAVTTVDTRLYDGPGREYAALGDVAAETALDVMGRDGLGHWLYVTAPDGRAGWVITGYTRFADDGTDLRGLPLVDAEPGALDPEAPSMLGATDDPDLMAAMERLLATPPLINADSPLLADVYAAGEASGNRADVFTRVGDSDTTIDGYLRPIGIQNMRYCDFGPYAYLTETVQFFSVSPREGVLNSFDNTSIAARNGLTMAAALDPLWADDPFCAANETPLACEFRRVRPSIAVIMLGRMDTIYFSEDFFRRTAQRVLDATLAAGVIPILTTFVVLPDDPEWEASLVFNNTLVDLAEANGVPLINLWRAVQPLPQFGIGPDLTHLSYAVGTFCAFTGSEQTYGGTMRNLLVLQALDEVRRSTLEQR